ncbi:MAG: hypothetical protein KBC43_12880 [Bacteroidales bacterium]|nr:hypothetical protein [Bacteroidales bacterium]
MQQKENTDFKSLKTRIVATMQQSYPGLSSDISEWKGQDIVNFQEELLQKVNAHISEKWFYTHMKSVGTTLPRIDVLNLLSRYAGYADWNDFVYRNGGKKPKPAVSSGNRYFILVPVMVIVILGIFYLVNRLVSNRNYTFCFYDATTREQITHADIEVKIILENESPITYLCSSDGCFTLKTDRSFIKMVVNSPYYRADTINRTLKKFNPQEIIGLQANDYALMLHYFSEMNTEDWQKRRLKLDEMFDESAMIYQVVNDISGTGMELYSKWEFIDKLTMPSHSLKNIEILDTKYIGDRIAVLRFRISDK